MNKKYSKCHHKKKMIEGRALSTGSVKKSGQLNALLITKDPLSNE
jgi:hypothetical protein